MTREAQGDESQGVPKEILRQWIVEALEAHGGSAELIQVCRHIWRYHEDELWDSGDLFYTWQYDVRWAATDLRGRGIMKRREESPRGLWELAMPAGSPHGLEATEVSALASEGVSQSPFWTRDELILALDLYMRRGNLNARDPDVIALSQRLRAAAPRQARLDNFRSPSSVNRKLGNFAAIDPDFQGRGLDAYGRRDHEIFGEFRGQPEKLGAAAREAAHRLAVSGRAVETSDVRRETS